MDDTKPIAVAPMECSPCAYVAQGQNCLNEAVSACAGCHLVTYCSESCQSKHWPEHKQSCKHRLRSKKWKPDHVVSGTLPLFSSTITLSDSLGVGECFSSLVPAVDIIKLSRNEGRKYTRKDISLAFVDGNLENFIHTVTGLPLDYAGTLTVLLNNSQPLITSRTIAILSFLGNLEQSVPEAVELALHYWYSSFLPAESSELAIDLVDTVLQQLPLFQDGTFSVKLGNNGKLLGSIGGKILTALVGQQISRRHWGLTQAREERRRVMYNQAREEVHQRFYANMDPSHRLAFEHFRQTGIVLPFGGSIAEFTEPNYSFFMPGCQTPEWLQHDQVQPLDSWDRPTVVEVGRAHGCHESDIFGCLYFYLSEELRAFAERLRRFKISICITSQTTKDLAPKIKEGAFESLGLQPTVQFDRIDFHICVLENRLTTPTELILNWGPLLKRENPHATMLGALMVWADNEPNGKLYDVSEISVANGPSADDFIRGVETTAVVAEFWRKGWIPMPVSGALNTPAIFSHVHVLHAVYDNSKAFAMYLERNDIPAIAKRAGLKLKTKHTVVPHRPIGVPLDAPFNAVPEFASREDFYLQVQLTSGITEFTERYVEFGPA